MKKNIFLIVFALCLFVCGTSDQLFAQGATCADATQLCDDPACGSYEIGSGQGNDPIAGESSSCVGGDPNATWFFLIDDQGGGGAITIANTPACDTDFVAWGPFDSPADALAACAGGISPANEVGCDFGTGPGGVINMPGTSQVGDVYLMVITNFSDDPGIDVTVTAPPLECCPVATGTKDDVDVCSGGGVPAAALTDFEGVAGEITGASQFLTDLGLSTSATALVAPTAADFTNTTCASTMIELFYLYECDANCNGAGDGPSVAGSFMVTIYPDASTFVVTETPGGCGTAATVSIATAGGEVCFSDAGAVPPAGTCPSTPGMAPLNYNFDPGFAVACNATYTGTVAADCAPTGCIDCPDIAPAIAAQEICSGNDPDFATAETEVNATGNSIGAFTYFTDAGYTTAYAGPLTNTTCASMDVTIYGRLQCSDAGAAGTADEFDDFSFVVTVYPDATTFVVTETPGGCGAAAMVSIATADGAVCFSDAGAAPADLGCGNTDVQDLNYSYDPGFAQCNMVFTATVAAQCVGTGCGCVDPCFVEYDPAIPAPGDPSFCVTPVTAMTPCDDGIDCTIDDMEVLGGDGVACVPCAGTPVDCGTAGEVTVQGCDDGDPCTINDEETILNCDGSVCVPCAGTAITPPLPTLTCPPAEVNYCDGSYDCMFLDSNPNTDGNGITDDPIITGTAAGATNNAGVIDLTQLSPGATYTLTLNYDENGCLGTPVTCTFTVVVPGDANGGSF